jgi:hypothetical protein
MGRCFEAERTENRPKNRSCTLLPCKEIQFKEKLNFLLTKKCSCTYNHNTYEIHLDYSLLLNVVFPHR